MTQESSKRPLSYYALYGAVSIKKGFCDSCNGYSFIIDGKLQCCETPFGEVEKRLKRECEGARCRDRPNKKERDRILAEQNFKCFWCSVPLNEIIQVYYKNGKIRKILIHWDHIEPYSYSRNNRAENFAASCNLCNSFKGAKMFESIEMAREVLKRRWAKKIEFLFPYNIVPFAEPNLLGVASGLNTVQEDVSNKHT